MFLPSFDCSWGSLPQIRSHWWSVYASTQTTWKKYWVRSGKAKFIFPFDERELGIRTSKNGLETVMFLHSHLEKCFIPKLYASTQVPLSTLINHRFIKLIRNLTKIPSTSAHSSWRKINKIVSLFIIQLRHCKYFTSHTFLNFNLENQSLILLLP